MSFEKLEAEIGLLVGSLEDGSADRMEIYERLREKLAEMRAYGMPVPDDLAKLERQLARELFGENG